MLPAMRTVFALALSLAAPSVASVTLSNADGAAQVDTSGWVGAEYQPSKSANEDWLWHYESYEPTIIRELRLAKQAISLTAVRVFMHSAIWDADDGVTLLANLDDFLSKADGVSPRFNTQSPTVSPLWTFWTPSTPSTPVTPSIPLTLSTLISHSPGYWRGPGLLRRLLAARGP